MKPDGESLEIMHENPAFDGAKTDGGYWITRKKYTRTPPRTFKFDLKSINNTDRLTLITFWNTIGGSSAAFNWANPQDNITYNVRFSAGYSLGFKRIAGGTAASGNHIWDCDGMSLTEV
jgi:hypothetical protein